MELIHYSDKVITEVRDTESDPGSRLKPRGLWVSVVDEHGDGWFDWCKAEGFRPEALRFAHEVILAADANVLCTDPWDVYHRYKAPGHTIHDEYVDWSRVAEDYDGIVIAPYCWTARSDMFWYYGWDCASGCIWRARAIESISLREEEMAS